MSFPIKEDLFVPGPTPTKASRKHIVLDNKSPPQGLQLR
jgi:hypothetical protein